MYFIISLTSFVRSFITLRRNELELIINININSSLCTITVIFVRV